MLTESVGADGIIKGGVNYMAIHYDIEVPIPQGARLYKETNPKYANRTIVVDVTYNNGRQVRQRIGVVSEHEGFMYPNEKYFELYGGDYLKFTHENGEILDRHPLIRQFDLSVGLFITVLAIAERLGLYKLLTIAFGIKLAHAILDYVCYLIRCSDNAVCKQTCQMYDQVLFTNPLYSDKWYSAFFCNKINLNRSNYFQELWIRHWVAAGITDVFLGVDGSNIDCESKGNEDAERGHDKSGQHTTILSFMWVVVASGKYKGMPLAYITYNGSQVDCGAFREIRARLCGFGLHIAGFILDRGFCTAPVMKEIRSLQSEFIIMMTGKIGGYASMVEKYADIIRMSSRYYIGNDRFGITDFMKVFKDGDVNSYIALYYNPREAADKSVKLMSGVMDAAKSIENAIENGKKYKIPNLYSEYISVIKNEDSGILKVVVDYEKLDKACLLFGFSSIASSKDLSAFQISEIYDMRSSSELAFEYFKTPLGEGVSREHTRTSASVKMFPGFLGVIIYNEFQKICKSRKMDASKTIIQLDRVKYVLSNHSYTFSNNYSRRLENLLETFGMSAESMRKYASVINERYYASTQRDTTSMHNVPYRDGYNPDLVITPVLSESGVDARLLWNFTLFKDDDDEKKTEDDVQNPCANSSLIDLNDQKKDGQSQDKIDDPQDNQKSDLEEKESSLVLLSNGRRISTEEKDARKTDLLLGDLIPAEDGPGTSSKVSGVASKKAGRPKGSKDRSPRKRRTYTELGKERKQVSPSRRKIQTPESEPQPQAKRGRPKGSKDSYQRVRRTRSELGKL